LQANSGSGSANEKSVRELLRSGGSRSHDEMQYQRDHGKNEQQVNQPTRDVKHGESTNPRNQQYHK
jgi:hypothetical protein